ncbi:hypothetical protein FBX98_1271 [Burkholderia sp. SJZ115]|nr:hypothetical protein WK69_26475 [Burkholderia ubonensis]TWC60313.1 hypothetical protein FB600_1281 [Burkholderia sp. SJZ089]TWC94766.1 hypothetical protein FBX98_1271 [Burkholderia sp. SJZ115]TWC96861.1 hypothetical protein FB601_1281 [Burkholderia sp. SJZ091]
MEPTSTCSFAGHFGDFDASLFRVGEEHRLNVSLRLQRATRRVRQPERFLVIPSNRTVIAPDVEAQERLIRFHSDAQIGILVVYRAEHL